MTPQTLGEPVTVKFAPTPDCLSITANWTAPFEVDGARGMYLIKVASSSLN